MRVKCNRCARKKSENDIEINKKEEVKKKKSKATKATKTAKVASDDKQKDAERAGDWVCVKCKNNNFSFRVVCNRCQLSKTESEKLFELHMNNLMQIGKVNENLQNQLQKQMFFEQQNLQMYYNNVNINMYGVQGENNNYNMYNVAPMYLVQKM